MTSPQILRRPASRRHSHLRLGQRQRLTLRYPQAVSVEPEEHVGRKERRALVAVLERVVEDDLLGDDAGEREHVGRLPVAMLADGGVHGRLEHGGLRRGGARNVPRVQPLHLGRGEEAVGGRGHCLGLGWCRGVVVQVMMFVGWEGERSQTPEADGGGGFCLGATYSRLGRANKEMSMQGIFIENGNISIICVFFLEFLFSSSSSHLNVVYSWQAPV